MMSFHIDPYLEMSICILARYKSFSLRKFSFEEIWRKKFPGVFNQKPGENYRCGDCPAGILCGNCPGLAYLEEGDPEATVEYLCAIGKLRAKWLGIEMEQNILVKGR
jgi:radical SAM protein with 4Fe4S-binding SPASM domain